MKIATIVGARPQFIKAAVVTQKLKAQNQEIIIHTGQHFDYNMSEQFFNDLHIPKPLYNLGISGGSHAQMTGKMLIEIEKVLLVEKPDLVLVYGDTNSTLAAGLASAKIHIPICHVEAGARTNNLNNPEEINRVCVDHIATLLLASTQKSIDNLEKENLIDRSVLVGDPMYDAFIKYGNISENMEHSLTLLDGNKIGIPPQYYYLTCHREENTSDDNLLEIFKAAMTLDYPVIYPVHPRNKERAKRVYEKHKINNILLAEPVGYFTSNYLVRHAEKIITDSGGLQREAFFAEKQCVTILGFEVWPETMVGNRNQLAEPKAEQILKKLNAEQEICKDYKPFGDGDAAEKICAAIENLQFKMGSY